jgi:hypothetical protein
MKENLATRLLGLRFGASRLCLWCLCRNRACRRARACIGETPSCTSLIADWVDAWHAERRERPDLDSMERDLATMDEVRAFRAWRLELDRVFEVQRKDPEVERMREEVARMTENLCRRLEQEREEALRREREEELIVGEGEGGEEEF